MTGPRLFPSPGVRALLVLGTVVLVSSILYVARPILLPFALAVLLTFILSPVVSTLERRGLGRALSVFLVVLLSFSVLGAAGYTLAQQTEGLAGALPGYEGVIKKKITRLRAATRGGVVERVRNSVNEVVDEIQKDTPAPPGDKAVPVVVRGVEPSLGEQVGHWVDPLAKTGLVFILVIFMLAERRELRNRFLRLFGPSRLVATTKAIDEATERITAYLLAQSFVNLCMGIGFGLGLWLIGVPYAMVWGVLLAVLRYVPYVGVWVALCFPLLLSVAVFNGWQQPLMVVGLFAVLEVAVGGFLEPIVYSQRAGVSKVALLLAVAFWTWLWGPAGLILATPLTVCLVVLAKHVPGFEFLVMLLGDEPALDTRVSYYQRLLAADPAEAADIVAKRLANQGAEGVYDEVLVPALIEARQDREAGRITDEEERFVYAATREIVEDLPVEELTADTAGTNRLLIVGCPARGAADEAALFMLCRLLPATRFVVDTAPAEMFSGEVVDFIAARPAAVICVASLPPDGIARTRYLCKRLCVRFPRARIVVGRFGDASIERSREALTAAGADRVCATLLDARDRIVELAQLGRPASEAAVSTAA